MPKTAREVFYEYAERLGWDCGVQAHILVSWCGEGMIEPLLRYIQEADQADDFEDFLEINYGEGRERRATQSELERRGGATQAMMRSLQSGAPQAREH